MPRRSDLINTNVPTDVSREFIAVSATKYKTHLFSLLPFSINIPSILDALDDGFRLDPLISVPHDHRVEMSLWSSEETRVLRPILAPPSVHTTAGTNRWTEAAAQARIVAMYALIFSCADDDRAFERTEQ